MAMLQKNDSADVQKVRSHRIFAMDEKFMVPWRSKFCIAAAVGLRL